MVDRGDDTGDSSVDFVAENCISQSHHLCHTFFFGSKQIQGDKNTENRIGDNRYRFAQYRGDLRNIFGIEQTAFFSKFNRREKVGNGQNHSVCVQIMDGFKFLRPVLEKTIQRSEKSIDIVCHGLDICFIIFDQRDDAFDQLRQNHPEQTYDDCDDEKIRQEKRQKSS